MNLSELINNEIKKMQSAPVLLNLDIDESLPLGQFCDHTVLRAYTKQEIVEEFCSEAIEYGAASVCVNPDHIKLVSGLLKGSRVKTSCVVGFPLGASTSVVKAREAAEAILDGADEIDMVINISMLKDKKFQGVLDDIRGVVEVVNGKGIVKVIIETCYLTREEKIAACVLSKLAGAAFVKTSTGMGTGGATPQDVSLMRQVVGDNMGVKASGGIETRDDVLVMLHAGATRMGCSRIKQIVTGDANAMSASKKNKPI